MKKSARIWKYLVSPTWMFLKSEKSKLLMPGSGKVLRPMLDSAPLPAWM